MIAPYELNEVRAHVLRPLRGLEEEAIAAASEAETSVREAYERGLAEGRRATEETLTSAAEALGDALRQNDAAREAGMQALQPELVRLALAVARQVVMSELHTRPEQVTALIEKLLAETEERKPFAIRLNPTDIALLEGTPVAEALRQANVTIHAAPETARGGCLLETGFGRLDARVETRLEEMASALLGRKPAREETA